MTLTQLRGMHLQNNTTQLWGNQKNLGINFGEAKQKEEEELVEEQGQEEQNKYFKLMA